MDMSEPIRVLQVLGGTELGGAESRIMDLYRNIDRQKVQFDFLVHQSGRGYYEDEIESLGGRVYRVPRFKVYNWPAYQSAVKQFFSAHSGFKAVHGHMTSTASIYLPIAKAAGIPVAIAHARSAGVDKGLKGLATRVIRRPLRYRADYCFACSDKAGRAVFGDSFADAGKVVRFPNAIDVKKFLFDPGAREDVRRELGIEGCFVIGHVGRFSFMKNHKYLLEVFAEVCKNKENARLLLVGKGELETEIREQAKRLGVLSKVIFTGSRGDVHRLYQAMDYFVFPSLFEGLPGTVVEAQASGLPCLVSDQVTKEVGVTKLVSFRSIKENPKEWAKEVLHRRDCGRADPGIAEQIAGNGFDASAQAAVMQEFYLTGRLENKVRTGANEKS